MFHISVEAFADPVPIEQRPDLVRQFSGAISKKLPFSELPQGVIDWSMEYQIDNDTLVNIRLYKGVDEGSETCEQLVLKLYDILDDYASNFEYRLEREREIIFIPDRHEFKYCESMSRCDIDGAEVDSLDRTGYVEMLSSHMQEALMTIERIPDFKQG